ncbi:MAG: hypothetical protein ACQER7_08140 [Bacteroidota bacterium]
MFRTFFICSALILVLTASIARADDLYDQCIQTGKEYTQCLETNSRPDCLEKYQEVILECEQRLIQPFEFEKIYPDSHPEIGSNQGSSCHEVSLRVEVCKLFSMIDGCKRILRKYRVSCL